MIEEVHKVRNVKKTEKVMENLYLVSNSYLAEEKIHRETN